MGEGLVGLGHLVRLFLATDRATGVVHRVDELAGMTDLSVANTSKHLQALRQAGLVSARKEGLRVYYSIAGDDVIALLSALRDVSEHRMAEVERLIATWLAHRDEMEPVPARELLARAKKGLVVVLDVRPPEEFAAGHLPGAINVPRGVLEFKIGMIPEAADKNASILLYCRTSGRAGIPTRRCRRSSASSSVTRK